MESDELTVILDAVDRGDSQAAAQLLPMVYDELRKLADSRLAKLPPGQTLQATALVHEAYVRLLANTDPGWRNRGHFFGAAAQAMRNILVDQARRKSSLKHGGDRAREMLPADLVVVDLDLPSDDLLRLDAALTRLEQLDERQATVVKLRYFAGLDEATIAEILGVSTRTVERAWGFARAWLGRELRERA